MVKWPQQRTKSLAWAYSLWPQGALAWACAFLDVPVKQHQVMDLSASSFLSKPCLGACPRGQKAAPSPPSAPTSPTGFRPPTRKLLLHSTCFFVLFEWAFSKIKLTSSLSNKKSDSEGCHLDYKKESYIFKQKIMFFKCLGFNTAFPNKVFFRVFSCSFMVEWPCNLLSKQESF